jgi:hypothetical protein
MAIVEGWCPKFQPRHNASGALYPSYPCEGRPSKAVGRPNCLDKAGMDHPCALSCSLRTHWTWIIAGFTSIKICTEIKNKTPSSGEDFFVHRILLLLRCRPSSDDRFGNVSAVHTVDQCVLLHLQKQLSRFLPRFHIFGL